MTDYRLGEVEMEFAKIVWENEPITSGQLAKQAFEKLKWKKSTAYTVLKRLCEKGILKNEDGTVTSCMSLNEFKSSVSVSFVENEFAGSLPEFVAAFTAKNKLSKCELEELQRMINAYMEE